MELDTLERRALDLRQEVDSLEVDDGEDVLSVHAPDDLEFGESASVYQASIVGSVAPSQAGTAGSDEPQPASEALRLLLERVAASLGLEWSDPEDDKVQIPVCPQFAVAFRESWSRMQVASASQRRFRPSRETAPWAQMANQDSMGVESYPTYGPRSGSYLPH